MYYNDIKYRLNVNICKEIAINIHFPNLFIIRDITKGSQNKSPDFHYKGQQPQRINTASEPSKRNSQLYFSFSSIIFIHRSYKMSLCFFCNIMFIYPVINIHHNYLNVKLLLLYFLSLIKHLVYENTALFLGGFMRRDHTWKCPL